MDILRLSIIIYCIFCKASGKDAVRQNEITFETSGENNDLAKHKPLSFYNYIVDNEKKEFSFSVKACRDASVALREDDTATSEQYEIIIGEQNNTMSAIRLSEKNRKEVQLIKEGLLDCKEFKDFVISWKDDVIGVYWVKKGKRTEFMTYPDAKHVNIRYIAVATETDGKWKVKKTSLSGSIRENVVSIRTIKQPKTATSYTYTPVNFFGYEVHEYETQFNFSVKACKDAKVSLAESGSNERVEVVLGSSDNTKVAIRVITNQTVIAHKEKETGHVVNCNHYKDFSISWGKDIEVFSLNGNTKSKLISYSSPHTLRIRDIGVSTGFSSEGVWKIKTPACYHTPRGEDYKGTAHKTSTGKLCQKWSSIVPPSHPHHSQPENFCRNPDSRPKPWCYTTQKKDFEYCDVHKCNPCVVMEEVSECTATLTLQGLCDFSYQLNKRCLISVLSKEDGWEGTKSDVLINNAVFELRNKDEHEHKECAILRQDKFKLTITYPVCEHGAEFKPPGSKHSHE